MCVKRVCACQGGPYCSCMKSVPAPWCVMFMHAWMLLRSAHHGVYFQQHASMAREPCCGLPSIPRICVRGVAAGEQQASQEHDETILKRCRTSVKALWTTHSQCFPYALQWVTVCQAVYCRDGQRPSTVNKAAEFLLKKKPCFQGRLVCRTNALQHLGMVSFNETQ